MQLQKGNSALRCLRRFVRLCVLVASMTGPEGRGKRQWVVLLARVVGRVVANRHFDTNDGLGSCQRFSHNKGKTYLPLHQPPSPIIGYFVPSENVVINLAIRLHGKIIVFRSDVRFESKVAFLLPDGFYP